MRRIVTNEALLTTLAAIVWCYRTASVFAASLPFSCDLGNRRGNRYNVTVIDIARELYKDSKFHNSLRIGIFYGYLE